ncbi:MAG TPA: twin-arginine translocase TatA/TatE family subunit [Patescibacteria group bacterium]|nr:twin-arginine translocase TatA/TatE family subunit [Patescibacteria group bacterium]
MFSNIGVTEVIIIILVLTVILGSKKMGELASNAGRAGAELKKVKKEYEAAMKELDKEINVDDEKKEKSEKKDSSEKKGGEL